MDSHDVVRNAVGKSPYGEADEIGRLNLITPQSRARALGRADASRVYDLSVELFMGMPAWCAFGEPTYQIWMNHTPAGTVVDNLSQKNREINEHIGYSSDSVTMITHTGTHIDSLNHWGYGGKIYNGFEADQHLGSRHWTRCGVDRIPPIVARGVLLDVAAAKGVASLPRSYPITVDDLRATVEHQAITLEEGDVVLVRTGWMEHWDDPQTYMFDAPGIDIHAAQWLVEGHGAMIVGSDQATVEYQPSTEVPGHYQPVHLYLLAEQGVPMLEILQLDELSCDRVYEFTFFGAPVRFRGATGAPIHPWVMPLLAED
jgi:kynurenine formamidase